jgi:hypothetical protein
MRFATLKLFASALVLSLAAAQASAALVTFSGLRNGINTATDPEITNPSNGNTGDPIPSNYQPLLNKYLAPGTNNYDGAAIGVTITWANAQIVAQSPGFPSVNDHTGMVTPSDNAEVGAYIDHGILDIQFDKSVEIPSLYFANFVGGGPYSIVFQGYTNVGDATPVVTDSSHSSYTQSAGGFQWIQETGLGLVPIKELKISGSQYIQTDDYTIVVPEPTSLVLLGLGAVGMFFVARRRRRAA